MKKLNKLQINSEKIMKNEELLSLRGGYDAGTCGWEGGSGWGQQCGYSKATVEFWSHQWGGNWCCDSCGQNGYC